MLISRIQSSLRLVSKLLLIVGIIFFTVRIDFGVAKPTEYFFSIAILLGLLHGTITNKFLDVDIKISVLIFGTVFSVLFATFLGLFLYGLEFDTGGIRLLLKLFLNVLSFICIYLWINEDDNFIKILSLAMAVPFAIYSIAWFLPSSLQMQLLNEPDLIVGRFQGFSDGVGSMAFPLVEAFCFSFVLWISESKNKLKKILYMFLTAILLLLEFWTASRICMIATAVCLLFGFYLVSKYSSSNGGFSSFNVFAWMGVLVFGAVIAFWFGALSFLNVALLRLAGAGFDQLGFFEMISSGISLILDPSINVRLPSHQHYQELVLANPFGYGVNYFKKMAFEINGEKLPTDSILDSLMHGGFLLVFIMVMLIFLAFKNAHQRCTAEKLVCISHVRPYLIGAMTALMGNVVFSLFGGFPIYSLRFWVILAMCLALSNKHKLIVG